LAAPLIARSKQIHLISPLADAAGGTAWRTMSLFDELRRFGKVSLWSEHEPHARILERYPVKRIKPTRLRFPKRGVFVFVGIHWSPGGWLRYTWPRRTILIYNNFQPEAFRRRIEQLSDGGRLEVEVLYASELIKASTGYPGSVQTSLVDVNRFSPRVTRSAKIARPGFTVGRMSRPVAKKHHPDDPPLYRRLVEQGCNVKIMGAAPFLNAELGDLRSVTLLPVRAQEPHQFLQELDCFFYRTAEEWLEPSGRVITEAMACGLPVVAHKRGGYVEIIDHGRNGFLFDTQQEALEVLLHLKRDPALRQSVGRAARATVAAMCSPARRREIVEFYLR
jgi:glycosyltransferase involved in cell wall biosynthesis